MLGRTPQEAREEIRADCCAPETRGMFENMRAAGALGCARQAWAWYDLPLQWENLSETP